MNFKFSKLLIVIICLGVFIQGCKLKNPTEGIYVYAKADAITAPSELLFFDASTGKPEAAMENVVVNVSGPAASFIYNSGGRKTITINNGIVQISFRKGTLVSEANPLKFNLEINASGYISFVKSFSLTSLDPIKETMFLVNLNNLPKGSAKTEGNTTTDPTGTTTAPITVTVPTSADKKEVAELTIPTGVSMKDKDGSPVTGTVAIDVLQFAGSGQQALDAFGNKGGNTIKDINGSTLNETVIAPLGWLNINMTAGGKEVKTFSNPVKGKIGIPAGLVNPITGAEYKEGDALSVLSKEDDGTEFKKEGTTTLQKATDGSLFAEINITHLSGWTIAQILGKCSFNYEMNILQKDVNIHNGIIPSGGPTELGKDFFTAFAIIDNITYFKENGEIFYEINNINLDKTDFNLNWVTKKAVLNIPVENLGPASVKINFIRVGGNGEAGVSIPKANNPCNIGTIVAGPSTEMATVKGKFRAKCTSGQANYAILPEGFKLYYIKNADYLAAGSPGLTNAAWRTTTLSIENGYNVMTENKASFTGGSEYRFAILYEGRRYEYLYNVPATIPDEITLEMSLPCQ